MAGNYEDKLVPLAGFVDGMARVSTELEKCRGVEWSIEMHNRDANAHPDLVDTLGAIYQTMLDDTAAMVERIKALEQLEERVQALEQSGGCGCGGGTGGDTGNTQKRLGELVPGDVVRLNENSAPVEYLVASQNYEEELNSAGGTLLLRKEPHGKRAWAATRNNLYSKNTILPYLNDGISGYLSQLDQDVRNAILITSIRHTVGGGSTSVTTSANWVFILSAMEYGNSKAGVVDGTALPIAPTLLANLPGENILTRTANPTSSDTMYGIMSATQIQNIYCDAAKYYVPAFRLPSTAVVSSDGSVQIKKP